MSAYIDACLLEQRGMAVLLPFFLESRAWHGAKGTARARLRGPWSSRPGRMPRHLLR